MAQAMGKNIAFLNRIVKVSDNVTITLCENGYLVDASGEDPDENWISSKIIFDGLTDLSDFLAEISKLDKR